MIIFEFYNGNPAEMWRINLDEKRQIVSLPINGILHSPGTTQLGPKQG